MHPSKAIDKILSGHLTPRMKSHGFRRKGQRFWRDSGHVIDVLELQKSQWNSCKGAQFTINLGTYWPAIGGSSSGRVATLSPKSYECTIVERIGKLFGDGRDFWWEVSTARDIPRHGQDVCEKVTTFGVPWLDSMHTVRAMLGYERRHPCLFAKDAVVRYLKKKSTVERKRSAEPHTVKRKT
jgi:hypothetical protein